MLKIAVLVSGGGTNLQALIDAQKSGEIKNGEIAVVISSKVGVYALERAKESGIEAIALPRKDYANAEEYSERLASELKARAIDLLVLAGFLTVISENFINAFENHIINVHPALIPAFSGKGFYGLHVHEAVLERGVKLTGATVHFVNAECDAGPIILQKAVEVLDNDTPQALQKRVMEEAEWVLLKKAVSLFCEGRLIIEGNTVKIL